MATETTRTVTSRPSGSPSRPSQSWIGRTRSGTMATAPRPSPTSSSPAAGTRLPGPAPAQPADRHEDHEDREGDADEAQQTDGHVPSV